MDDEFRYKQYLQGTFEPDPIYECFVEAWIAYHKAADEVDGHLPLGDRSLNRYAILAGNSAMKKYMDSMGLPIPSSLFDDDVTDWNRAKLEALRRIIKND